MGEEWRRGWLRRESSIVKATDGVLVWVEVMLVRVCSNTGKTRLPGDSCRSFSRAWRKGQSGKQTSRFGRVGTCAGS
jgi:hypothetical protein